LRTGLGSTGCWNSETETEREEEEEEEEKEEKEEEGLLTNNE